MHSQSANGSVAQLNRVLAYGSSGYRFESCRRHLIIKQLSETMTAFFVRFFEVFRGFRGICVNQCVNKIGYEHLSIRCFLLIKETIQCQTIKECNLHSFMSIENRFSIFRYGQVPLLSMISYPSDARSKQCRLLRMG